MQSHEDFLPEGIKLEPVGPVLDCGVKVFYDFGTASPAGQGSFKEDTRKSFEQPYYDPDQEDATDYVAPPENNDEDAYDHDSPSGDAGPVSKKRKTSGAPEGTKDAPIGWGNCFGGKKVNQGWKCDGCNVYNDPVRYPTKCSSCDKPKPGTEGNMENESNNSSRVLTGGTIGVTGFSFGGESANVGSIAANGFTFEAAASNNNNNDNTANVAGGSIGANGFTFGK